MHIEKPIIIIGTGRSGSTIFHTVFTKHPEVAWLAGKIGNKYPNKPQRNRLFLQLIDYPIIGSLLESKVRSGENYPFWEYYCKGFSQPYRNLLPDDVTFKNKKKLQWAMSQILTQKRNRLLLKITGWPRIGFLKEVFEDACFIHVLRDGRAVANSIINVGFWRGWQGPSNWRWGNLTQLHAEEWAKYDHSFVVLAAIQWKILMDAVEETKQHIDPENFLDVKYEDLCTDPIAIFKNAFQFCELPFPADFEKVIKKQSWKNANYKWEQDLTGKQQKMLNETLQEYLLRYNYI